MLVGFVELSATPHDQRLLLLEPNLQKRLPQTPSREH
jgi:hypothetical protein